jgi:tRNA threonylcarbamoyladenosine biosynthesis protein TsaE
MVPERRFTTRSREETASLGEALAEGLRPGDVVAMDGDLGAGKTAMTSGIARGLGVRGAVSSPTFTLLIEHGAGSRRLALHHFDAYRLSGSAEFLALGFDEVLDGDGVSVVEWAERVREALPPTAIHVIAQRRDDEGEDLRDIRVVFPVGREPDAALMTTRYAALRSPSVGEEGATC